MRKSQVDDLPEELLISVFEYLDSSPPSRLKRRHEPSLDLIRSSHQPLKSISRVCKKWRRVALPLLFTHATIRIDIPQRDEWADCPACSKASARHIDEDDPRLCDIEPYHLDMVKAYQRSMASREDQRRASSTSSTVRPVCERTNEASTASWAWRFYHVLHDFCQFVEAANLTQTIESLVVLSGSILDEKALHSTRPWTAAGWRLPASAAFWQHVFSTVQPTRVAIIAPIDELVCLTNASIDAIPDWRTGNESFHLLELERERGTPQDATPPVPYAKLQYLSRDCSHFAGSSLLFCYDWAHISLNEGSFLEAYATLDCFEHGTPPRVASIKHGLAPSKLPSALAGGIHSPTPRRSFTYTAIFPFADHANFYDWLPHVEELDVQLSPHEGSTILDDRERMGRVEMEDCWYELQAAYHDLAGTVATEAMSAAKFPHLKRLVCRDFQNTMLREELDDIFAQCCLPVWVEWQPGVFERQAMSAHVSA